MIKYYDITESIPGLIWFLGVGLAVLVFSTTILLYLSITNKSRVNQLRAGFMSVFSLIWVSIIWAAAGQDYFRAKLALKNHTYEVVEGRVEHFHPMPKEGHEDESFSVKGIPFKYSEFKIDFGYNQCRVNGGPVYQGKLVKIHAYKGRILRLWVCDTCPFDLEGVAWDK